MEKRNRKIRKAKGEFTKLHLVHLPKEIAEERNIPTWLAVGACIRGHWLPRSTKGHSCRMCAYESKKQDPRHYILMRIKQSAKNRGLEFNLTAKDIVIPKLCPILNVPIVPIASGGYGASAGTRSTAEYGASVDRLDPEKGYIKGNVWVISFL